MSAETIFVGILSTVFAVLGGFIAIRSVLPKLADVLDAAVEDQTAVDGVITLLQIFVIVTITTFAIGALAPVHPLLTKYLNTVKPGLDIIMSLAGYISYLFVGIGALLVIKMWKKK